MSSIITIFRMLTPRERRLALMVLGLLCLAGLLEAVVVGSTYPFLNLLLSTRRIDRSVVGFTSPLFALVGKRPRVVLGIFLICLIAITNLISVIATIAQMRFVYGVGHRVSSQLLAAFLYLPYGRAVQVDVARSMKHILNESDQLVDGALKPLFQMASSTTVLAAIALVLLRVSALATVVVIGALGVAYGAFYVALRGRVQRLGTRRTEVNRGRFRIVSESLGGFKEISVSHLQRRFLDRFEDVSTEFARLNSQNQLRAIVPRYLLETLAISSLIGVGLVLAVAYRDVQSVLPKVAIFAFGGYRMLPAFQRLLSSATHLRFHKATFESLAEDLHAHQRNAFVATTPLRFFDAARFISVTVAYPGRERPAIQGASLEIRRGEGVALVGRTGVGKSTVADVFLGLVEPTSGAFVVDGVRIDSSNRTAWQANIAYVPQRIFLADDTIRANIAFGIEPERIDEEALREAIDLARVDEFVMTLPLGLDTVVGERGVRLSGGQQQRIGIARALYRRLSILVLDEATSDLDAKTQAEVMLGLRRARPDLTILVIAHRLAAATVCDRVYRLDEGRVVDEGSIAQLRAVAADSAYFE